MESTISGTVSDGILSVSEMHIYGEGSGTSLRWIIEPALKESTGLLVASRVWEGGESIDNIVVVDGEVEVLEIEI